MNFQWKFFQNKVARRIFLFFIMSALIPILMLAAFQMTQIHNQLQATHEQQMRQEAKNIGMELIGRLFHFDKEITLIGNALNVFSTETLQAQGILKRLDPGFSALTVSKKNGLAYSLKGELLSLPQGIPNIQEGGTWVYSSELPHASKTVFVHRFNLESYLIGSIQTIGDFDLQGNVLLWILGPKNQLIYSNSSMPFPTPITANKEKKDTGVFTWEVNTSPFIVSYWSVFLKQRLHSNSWVVVLAEPKTSLLFSSYGLYTTFLPTILLALLLTMFLSQLQIRRSLIPLENLREATRRIAVRDFSQPVRISSQDEFQELGEAFNVMAKRLHRQFQTLSLLSTLDKSILVTRAGDAALNILFERLKEVVDYDLLILGVIQYGDPVQTVQLSLDDRVHPYQMQEVAIQPAELEALNAQQEWVLSLATNHLPNYLSIVKNYAIHHVILFPILHKGRANAFIGLGFKNDADLQAIKNEKLHDLFYRASVAYTHAEWEETLYHQAHYDDLTNLPNRLMVRDEMNDALERALSNKHHCVLMFIDMDNFKDINDTLGHGIGDYFLERVAARMQESIYGEGLLARIGGDEFTFLKMDLPTHKQAVLTAKQLAEKLLHAFDAPFYLKKMAYHASISIGIALFPDDCDNSDDLLKFADMSMFRAKEKGKNQYVFFSSELESIVRERNQLIQEMHAAVEENQFLVYFQPKIDCRTQQLVGAEALIRWQHPTRGLLLPERFLRLAEESDLIFVIGEWVLRAACEQFAKWQEKSLKLPSLAVNLAAKQFTQGNLDIKIKHILEETGVHPEAVELEITENALIENFNETTRILRELEALGCRLSIDDFGTGYSSMHYLRTLPLHVIKIDRVFIQGLPADKKNVSIIKAIITLASNLDKQLVAEGIETQQQADFLQHLGCFIQQGYYYSAPLPADEFAKRFLQKTSPR